MDNENKTAVYLTDEDARLFQIFLEYYEKIKKLINWGFFEIADDHATVHFDSEGMPKKAYIPNK